MIIFYFNKLERNRPKKYTILCHVLCYMSAKQRRIFKTKVEAMNKNNKQTTAGYWFQQP